MREKMKKEKNRYLLLLIATIANFPTGSAAIWSIFQPYAKEYYNIPTSSANMPFSVFMAAFVVGNILGGVFQRKVEAKKIIAFGSIELGIGLLLTAFIPVNMPFLLSVTYGILGGMGGGITYNVMIATITKWFPDRKGMASGIIVCMVGAHGFIMSPICNSLLGKYGFSKALIIVGVFFIILMLGLGGFVVAPPEGYMADYVPKSTKNVTSAKDYTASEMLKTKQFYFVAGAMALGTTAYFLINPMVKSLGIERGISETMAVATVMIVSVSNCAGRLIIPWVSDRLGRKVMLIFLFIESMAAVLGMTSATGSLYMVLAGAIAFGYGGFFGIFPVVSNEQFGSKNAGMNYGIVMIGYGIVSLLCPYLVAIGVNFAFTVAAISCVVGMILTILIKSPKKA